MLFDTLVKSLDEQGAAVRAYEACARAARGRILRETENAAALLLISYAAQRFVDAYDDQPLTLDAAGEELEQFASLVSTLENGFVEKMSAEEKVAALNAVAMQLAASQT